MSFDLRTRVPPGCGEIVRVEWDFESTGKFSTRSELDEIGPDVHLCETHTYDRPGTHFAVARVTSQREGDAEADYRLIQNLARVRVVVE